MIPVLKATQKQKGLSFWLKPFCFGLASHVGATLILLEFLGGLHIRTGTQPQVANQFVVNGI